MFPEATRRPSCANNLGGGTQISFRIQAATGHTGYNAFCLLFSCLFFFFFELVETWLGEEFMPTTSPEREKTCLQSFDTPAFKR